MFCVCNGVTGVSQFQTAARTPEGNSSAVNFQLWSLVYKQKFTLVVELSSNLVRLDEIPLTDGTENSKQR